ncbi:ABC transporter permease [Embleya sp. NBC_00896]|uniref:ABC transporter permease n=1 Tax=Embleya sp. NBC_00896 TaxID=2975961 RepID=UPI002F909ECF|nr:ABC transporter permease [Embleya sp. NBC_00896]
MNATRIFLGDRLGSRRPDQDPPAKPRKRRTGRKSVWRSPLAVTGLTILAMFLIAAVFASVLAPEDPLAQNAPKFQGPSGEHWFGTDQLGRDVLSRVIHGTRVSLPLALLLVVLSMTIGTVLGAIAGYFGGWIDMLIMRCADLVLAFPGIILAMAVVAALGPNLTNAVLAVVVVSWPTYARVVRGLVLTLRQSDFVQAGRLLGASGWRTLSVDLRPNLAGPVAVLAALDLGNAVLLLSGLSFLGLGAQPPTAEWGAMVNAGAQNFDSWWVGVFPGLAILLSVLAFNFLGDTLRDALDPRTARAIRG